MVQGNYASEYAQNLMRKQQTMGGVPILDLTNWQAPKYISGDSGIRSLPISAPHGACHAIEVKTTVDDQVSKCPIYVKSSIVKCTGQALDTCPSNADGLCPAPDGTVSTTDYINFIAVFTMGAAQDGIEVTFKYVEDGVPKHITKLVDASGPGPVMVYAFDLNIQFDADTVLVLYGAEVLA
jgi:hypothetical protein